jgi:hypothetical protein
MNLQAPSLQFGSRLRAALVHLLLSLAVAALAALLVFAVWYPMPYRQISGGRELFLLVVAVDVAIGPLITLAVFDRRKPRAELVRDMAVVAALQLAALAYGLYTVAQARPAVVALEGDRLRVVRAIDLASADFSGAPPALARLSWIGPQLLATRRPDASEKLDAIDRGLAGEDVGMRPKFWLPPEQTGPALARAAKPFGPLLQRLPARAAEVNSAIAATGLPADQVGYLPLLARQTDWSALVDRRSGAVVGFVNIDGF